MSYNYVYALQHKDPEVKQRVKHGYGNIWNTYGVKDMASENWRVVKLDNDSVLYHFISMHIDMQVQLCQHTPKSLKYTTPPKMKNVEPEQ